MVTYLNKKYMMTSINKYKKTKVIVQRESTDKDEIEVQFMKIYNEYASSIFRYCYCRVLDREKANDLVQETYCRIFKYISGGKEIKNIKALIYKIAKNVIIDDVRKKKSFSLDQIMEKGFNPVSVGIDKNYDYFTGKEILNIVETLDKKYKDTIILKYVYDLSNQEISLVLNETANTIYVRIHRGFKKIKKIFDYRNQKISEILV